MNRNRNKRYYECSDGKNVTGTLSAELRNALSLEDDMLPFWIYRMRILGYPPSWMKEAQLSLLSVINDSESTENPFGYEDGELVNNLQYNKDSLIEFPGFNCPLPDGVKDDWLILGMPPYQKQQQLSEAIKSMKLIEPVPYKKSKLDLDNIQDSPSSPVQDKSSNSFQDDSKDNLNDDSDNVTTNELNESVNPQDTSSCSESKDFDADSNSNNTTLNESERKLKMISVGTPVPQTYCSGLPPLEKWSVGMGELLYFENLPTSTGAYNDKMKNILDKIRNRFEKK